MTDFCNQGIPAPKMPNQNHSVGEAVALDLGGTWIKGGAGGSETLLPSLDSIRAHRWPNPLAVVRTAEEYAEVIVSCCRELAGGKKIASVAISTAGEVAPSGRAYRTAAHHLAAMTLSGWLDLAEEKLGCQISLINDAEAFLLGVAASGRLPARGQVAGVAVGTGLGFCVVRDGRWWKPGRRLNLLGSILVPDGNYDTWSSAVRAAHASGGDLHALLSGKNGVAPRDAYLSGLARILASAATLFQLDRIFLGGGLSEAASGVPLAAELTALLPPLLLPGQAMPEIEVVEKGNLEVLRGTLALAAGLATGNDIAFEGSFGTLATEQAGQTLRIEENPPEEIARLLAESESEAANRFLSSAPLLGTQASILRSKLSAGGRAIYVGAGTSGRLAAIDAVEIPCTFGMARERFVAVIAGGIADAAVSIEEDAEEDFSAVPDLVLLNPGPDDFVVGISASGTAFFVRSALAYARARGAHTLLLHEAGLERSDFFDASIPLHSGGELVRGSTRMKAGTATKKALNILSTTAMILMGKVRSGYMVDLDSSNRKLQERAARILADLGRISLEEAGLRLAACQGNLLRALDDNHHSAMKKTTIPETKESQLR
jgi:N-acetylmuramic acid 6-phosphate etherase